jgi:ABC-type phosphate transport system auxiliary subunit
MTRFDVHADKFRNMQLRQIEHMKRQLEARETLQSHTNTRRKWLERQKNANFRNEYDRIRGELSRSALPHQSKVKLQNREKELERLFSRGNV